jgi:hypothetical protein
VKLPIQYHQKVEKSAGDLKAGATQLRSSERFSQLTAPKNHEKSGELFPTT